MEVNCKVTGGKCSCCYLDDEGLLGGEVGANLCVKKATPDAGVWSGERTGRRRTPSQRGSAQPSKERGPATGAFRDSLRPRGGGSAAFGWGMRLDINPL